MKTEDMTGLDHAGVGEFRDALIKHMDRLGLDNTEALMWYIAVRYLDDNFHKINR